MDGVAGSSSADDDDEEFVDPTAATAAPTYDYASPNDLDSMIRPIMAMANMTKEESDLMLQLILCQANSTSMMGDNSSTSMSSSHAAVTAFDYQVSSTGGMATPVLKWSDLSRGEQVSCI